MTAEEAIDQCLGAGISTETNEPVGWLDTDKLRSLGYVIISVTPSGETIERAAANFAKQDSGAAEFKDEPLAYQGYARQEVRRLYAAIVGVEK